LGVGGRRRPSSAAVKREIGGDGNRGEEALSGGEKLLLSLDQFASDTG
jgi:hypothetical protein